MPDLLSQPVAAPMVVKDLAGGWWRDCAFEFFREGIEICHPLPGEPAVALLRYAPGAHAPAHLHQGLESIFVLEGSQRDERGTYGPGCLVLNPQGSVHSVTSDKGCVVLLQWVRPVRFLDE